MRINERTEYAPASCPAPLPSSAARFPVNDFVGRRCARARAGEHGKYGAPHACTGRGAARWGCAVVQAIPVHRRVASGITTRPYSPWCASAWLAGAKIGWWVDKATSMLNSTLAWPFCLARVLVSRRSTTPRCFNSFPSLSQLITDGLRSPAGREKDLSSRVEYRARLVTSSRSFRRLITWSASFCESARPAGLTVYGVNGRPREPGRFRVSFLGR